MKRLLGRRRLYRLVLLLLLAIAGSILAAQPDWLDKGAKTAQQHQPGLYTVEEVSDGDTIIVNMNGTREIVRMIGVDTPETHHPSRPVECFGEQASEYTRKLLEGQRVRLQADSLDTNRDRYDRLLRYVYLIDGTLLEAKIISEGYGFSYTLFPFEKAAEFNNYEGQAKTAKKGLWSVCQVTVADNGSEHTNPAN